MMSFSVLVRRAACVSRLASPVLLLERSLVSRGPSETWRCPHCARKGTQLQLRRHSSNGPGGDPFDGLYDGPETIEELMKDAKWMEDDAETLVKPAGRTSSGSRMHLDRLVSNALAIPRDYRVEIPEALQQGDAERLVRAIISAANDADYIRSLPNPTFSEILRLVITTRHIENTIAVHYDISAAMARHLRIYPLPRVLHEFVDVVLKMNDLRKSSLRKLSLEDYKHLLECASFVCSKGAAQNLWRDMEADGILPDTECFNFLLHATVWNHHPLPNFRQRARITPFNVRARTLYTKPGHLIGGYSNYRLEEGGIKQEVTRLFSDMLRIGVQPDEGTFTEMIAGFGREGDMPSVYKILERSWNVDVAALKRGAIPLPATTYETASTVEVTQKLLYVLAHVFGVNNDVPTAMTLIDLLVQRYNVEVSPPVWAHLFEWTFVHSRPDSRAKRDGEHIGHMSWQAPELLWNIMTSRPFNMKPTIRMHKDFIRHLTLAPNHYTQTDKVRQKILEVLDLVQRSEAAAAQAEEALKKAKNLRTQGYPISVDEMEELNQQANQTCLIRKRDRDILRRCVRVFLVRRLRSGCESIAPELFHELESAGAGWAIPNYTWYRVPTGTLEVPREGKQTGSRKALRSRWGSEPIIIEWLDEIEDEERKSAIVRQVAARRRAQRKAEKYHNVLYNYQPWDYGADGQPRGENKRVEQALEDRV